MMASSEHGGLAASDWFIRWAALLPTGATVLDVACGSGRHVRWLAQRGFKVTALDRDGAAVEALRELAGVEVIVADIENHPWPLAGRQFDAVVVNNYLWRALWPDLRSSLSANGMLIYETFNVDNASLGKPSNPDFLLRHGELLELASGLRVLAYEDGFLSSPDRQVQRIAAVRPADDQPNSTSVSATQRRYPL